MQVTSARAYHLHCAQTQSHGAARTVHLDVHESGGKGGKGGGHVTARLHMPAPGGSELGSLVITKRGAQGFTPQASVRVLCVHVLHVCACAAIGMCKWAGYGLGLTVVPKCCP